MSSHSVVDSSRTLASLDFIGFLYFLQGTKNIKNDITAFLSQHQIFFKNDYYTGVGKRSSARGEINLFYSIILTKR